MNSIASIATVATGPCASREATIPAAMSIWLSTQPPKMWPLALMSEGPGTTLRIGSPRPSLIVFIPVAATGLVVMARAVAEKEEAHQPGADQHGEADSGDGRDHHLDRHRVAEALQINEREQHRDDRRQHHPAHDLPIARPGGGGALVIGLAPAGRRIMPGHGFHLVAARGIIKARVAPKDAKERRPDD